MSTLQIIQSYPAVTLYGIESQGAIASYTCITFIALNGETPELYRQITRIHDKAYQIIQANAEHEIKLYQDANMRNLADISISGQWIIPNS